MTYLDHVNQNNRIIILQIHSVLRTDNTSDSLDDRVSVEFVIPPHRRADGILQRPVSYGTLLDQSRVVHSEPSSTARQSGSEDEAPLSPRLLGQRSESSGGR